jgi:predicted esterase
MIIKAMEIAEAVEGAVFDEGVMANAKMLMALHTMGADEETFMKAIFAYSAMLSATVGDKVTKVLISENDFDKMLNEIQEFQELEKGVLGE